MDYLSFLLLLSLALPIFIVAFRSKILSHNSLTLPPGPKAFPIIGNILQMGTNPHHSLANLSKTFGPIMTLKLGTITTIVISSPEFAKEALQKNDQALSSRTIPDAARPHDHHKLSVAWLPASNRWRSLRKIMTTELFTSRKLEASQDLRQKKVHELLVFVGENCKTGQAIDIGQAAFTTVLNLISNTFFSIDLASYDSNVSLQFYDPIVGSMEQLGRPNLADYFPIFRIMDPQGIYRRTKLYYESLFKHDLLDFLVNIGQDENNFEFSRDDIKHLMLDFFIAGIDTTAKTLEWGMAEFGLSLSKAQALLAIPCL
ncbi:Cytochrome P450 76T24 [Euphorbia peplus]|nr:Cytochrome P450 76T24 [Euphorbia peplus]